MTLLAEFPLDSNAIIVVVAVIFAAIKAFIEKKQKKEVEESPPIPENEEEEYDPYLEYEAELERQRREREIVLPVRVSTPPPLITPPAVQVANKTPVRPKLSDAEKKALKNLNLNSHRQRKGTSRDQSTKSRVYLHLSSPTAAREALVLAEVLGPPKAFKGRR